MSSQHAQLLHEEPETAREAAPEARATASKGASLAVSRKLLLALYAIVPASLALMILDSFALDGLVRRTLPSDPSNLLLFSLLFNLPHIVASGATFADREYLSRYGRKIGIAAALIVAPIALWPGLVHWRPFELALSLWTVIHVVGQQFGMVRVMGKADEGALKPWRWSAIAVAILVYLGTFADELFSARERELLAGLALSGLAVFLGFSVRAIRSARTMAARRYSWANVAMISVVVLAFALRQPFFVILIPRVLHDLSAFAFYVPHDVNRNAGQRRNVIHRALGRLGLPSWAITPVFALALAAPLTFHADETWAIRIAVALSLFHYWTDGFAWKQGSPHRESIQVS